MKKELSCQEIVRSCLDQIAQYNPRLNAFLTVCQDRALLQAERLDEKIRKGQPTGFLTGVPIALKDNIMVEGERLTCASKIFDGFIAPYNATVVERLESEGAIILGKTNLDEFAMGSSTEYSAFGPSRNPWDPSRTPGGSSGGSAAAVAAGMCPIGFGSDTGGSVRHPGSFCGVSAFKPSYGRVSRYGLVSLGSSLDQIGPLAYTVEEIELVMRAVGVPCSRDSTSLREKPFTPLSFHEKYSKGLTIGVPFSFLKDLTEEPRRVFDKAVDELVRLGAKIVEVDLSQLVHVVPVYYIVGTAEFSTNLARFDGIRYGYRSPNATTLDEVYTLSRGEGFGREVKRRLMLGTFVLSSGYQEAYYRKAQKVRAVIVQQFNDAFKACDVVAMPVTATSAFPVGFKKDPLSMYLEDLYTIGADLAGLPALSVPSGEVRGLPYGLQIIGPQLADREVLAIGRAYQERQGETKKPNMNWKEGR